MPVFPGHVLTVLDTLRAAGHRAYAVGGCVRDTLLGRGPHDWDVATDAGDGEIVALFEHTVPTGARYGTVTVLLPGGAVEVTTFRRDGEYLDGRKPETVEFVDDIREDLARRDLTVNAMAMDGRGDIIDPFGGREDIKRKLLRTVGDPERRFSEDALRMLRLLRFHAQLGFECDGAALNAVRRLAPLAARLSAERVREELCKTLLSPRPASAVLMIEYGLLAGFMSENGKNIPAARLSEAPGELRMAVFALMVRNTGAVPSAEGLLRALRCTARECRLAGAAERAAEGLAKMPVRLALAEFDAEAVLTAAAAGGFYGEARAELEAGSFTKVAGLAVTGEDLKKLGFEGRKIREILRFLSLSVTSGETKNEKPALLERIKAHYRDNKQ